ncbi:hypothetical protein EVAR_29034_1 [Eumeta japonica]|uniref:Uncharacterized protein n=1 Tax=Eumeta variegata TaxID=151549 RepID=A0A4C1W166_EUMVA|nr:hypothetical protein EVAR_29034_1 [Eumeta japonica]
MEGRPSIRGCRNVERAVPRRATEISPSAEVSGPACSGRAQKRSMAHINDLTLARVVRDDLTNTVFMTGSEKVNYDNSEGATKEVHCMKPKEM